MSPENAAVSVQVLCTPFKHAPVYSVTSLKPYRQDACVFICSLQRALFTEWLGSFMYYFSSAVTRGGTDTEISVSTESWLWRIKFSCLSCRDLNPGSFELKSDALTTELSPLPGSINEATLWQALHDTGWGFDTGWCFGSIKEATLWQALYDNGWYFDRQKTKIGATCSVDRDCHK